MKVAFTKTAAAASFAFALAISAVPAFAQYYPGGYNNGGYNNGYQNERQISGTVASFGGFNMTLQTNNGGRYGGYNGGYNGRDRDDNGRHHRGNGNNGNNNGRWNDNNNCDRDGDDCRNQNNNGRWNNNNGGWNNGGYNNGGYNGMPVHLHQGTVINPTGTTLQPGMNVRVYGHPNGDGSFEADRIDLINGNGYRY